MDGVIFRRPQTEEVLGVLDHFTTKTGGFSSFQGADGEFECV